MFILTRETLPPASATAFSSAGASCLHGPHHGAQKSTRTGWRVEAVSTSARKEAVVTSLTGLALVSGAVAPLTFAMSHHLQPERRQSPRAPVSHIFLTKWRRSALYSTGGPILFQRRHDRLMAGRPQELDEIGVSEPGRARVDEGMKVQPLMAHHRFIEHDGNLACPVVDRAEWGDVARPNAPDLFQELGGAERNAPLRPDFLMHPLEVDDGLLAEHQQEKATLPVLDEQVFRVAARNIAAQGPRVLDREQGRMVDGLGFDAERGEIGDEIFG